MPYAMDGIPDGLRFTVLGADFPHARIGCSVPSANTGPFDYTFTAPAPPLPNLADYTMLLFSWGVTGGYYGTEDLDWSGAFTLWFNDVSIGTWSGGWHIAGIGNIHGIVDATLAEGWMFLQGLSGVLNTIRCVGMHSKNWPPETLGWSFTLLRSRP